VPDYEGEGGDEVVGGGGGEGRGGGCEPEGEGEEGGELEHFEWFSMVERSIGVDVMRLKAGFYVVEGMGMRTMLELYPESC
jgi:hypothetical protein